MMGWKRMMCVIVFVLEKDWLVVVGKGVEGVWDKWWMVNDRKDELIKGGDVGKR